MAAQKLRLQAGPLSIVFGDGDLRHVRLGGSEVLDRVYVAIRDPNWVTIPGRIEKLAVVSSGDEFSISFDSIHQAGEIDFRWRADIRGDRTGKITFGMDGEAHGSFLSNRISICVLHPLEGCVGRPCTIEKAAGGTEQTTFPDLIAPHQPFLDVRAMTHRVVEGVEAEVRFTGGIFETEDQRNWSDASFKTYAPPLAVPYPVEWKPGMKISQAVELSLRGDVRGVKPAVPRETVIQLTGEPAKPLPALGLRLPSDGADLSDVEVARLRTLRLSHLRAEFSSGEAAERACREAGKLGLELEAAVEFPCAIRDLRRFSPQVKHWLILDGRAPVTSADALSDARKALGAEAILVAGTDRHFVDLNRNRPAGLNFDGVCYSVYPQVHAVDDETIMGNASPQEDVIRTARSFLADRALYVTPVTLGRRLVADPRQQSSFCAAWTVGSLKYLAEGGAASVTYFETHGPRGIQDGAGVFPVYQVFEWLAAFSGETVLPCKTTGDARVEGMVVEAGGRRMMLLANLTDEPQPVRVTVGAGQSLTLSPYEVKKLEL